MKNPDKGFDPEDPAVKGLEDWECSNLATSFDSEVRRYYMYQSKVLDKICQFRKANPLN